MFLVFCDTVRGLAWGTCCFPVWNTVPSDLRPCSILSFSFLIQSGLPTGCSLIILSDSPSPQRLFSAPCLLFNTLPGGLLCVFCLFYCLSAFLSHKRKNVSSMRAKLFLMHCYFPSLPDQVFSKLLWSKWMRGVHRNERQVSNRDEGWCR